MFTGNELNLINNNELNLINNWDEWLHEELKKESDGFRVIPIVVRVEHRGRVFSYPDGTTKRQLSGVILKSRVVRGYWRPGSSIPVCVSTDGITGKDSAKGVHECLRCPKNQWGSAVKLNEAGQPVQGKGKACKEMRRILFYEDGTDLPVVLSVPPSSLKAFDSFATLLRTKRRPLITVHVVVRLEGAEANGNPFARLVFDTDGEVPREELPRLIALRDIVLSSVNIAQVTEVDAVETPGETDAMFEREIDLAGIEF